MPDPAHDDLAANGRHLPDLLLLVKDLCPTFLRETSLPVEAALLARSSASSVRSIAAMWPIKMLARQCSAESAPDRARKTDQPSHL